jgi:hypothetical protein
MPKCQILRHAIELTDNVFGSYQISPQIVNVAGSSSSIAAPKRSIHQIAKANKIIASKHDGRDAIIDNIVHLMDMNVSDGMIVDLSPYIPEPVGDQGNTSICVAESTTAMKSCQDQCATLNPYAIYSLRDDRSGDNGMSLKEAMHILFTYGTNSALTTSDSSSHVVQQEESISKENASHRILAYGHVYSLQVVQVLLKLAQQYCIRHAVSTTTPYIPLSSEKSVKSADNSHQFDSHHGFNIGCLPCILPVYNSPSEQFWENTLDFSDLNDCGVWNKNSTYIVGDTVAYKGLRWTIADQNKTSPAAVSNTNRTHDKSHGTPSKTSTIWNLLDGQSIVGYHCVAIVGYDPNTKLLKMRNSWGLDFDDHGYFYVPFRAWHSVIECWFGTCDTGLAQLIQQQVANKQGYHSTIDGEEYVDQM